MSLFRKMRTLIGALVHAPFTAGPEKAAVERRPAPPAAGSPARGPAGLEREQQDAIDDSRVADLIARHREGGGP